MKKKSRIVRVIIFIMMIILLQCFTNAADVSILADDTKEFDIVFNLEDIKKFEEGINAYQGTLRFDSNLFELVEIKGNGKWNNPIYNQENVKSGSTKIVGISNEFNKEEDIFTITVKLKDNTNFNGKTDIILENISVANKTNNKIEKTELTPVVKVVNIGNIDEVNAIDPIRYLPLIIVSIIAVLFIILFIMFLSFRKKKGGSK